MSEAPSLDVDLDPDGSLVVEPMRFAMVPEWLLDAQVSDCAVRLYAVLLRYGQSSGQRMPSRALLARRLHKSSVDTVDRALRELTLIGAVVVERRREGTKNLTNRYRLRTSDPWIGPALPVLPMPVRSVPRGDKLDVLPEDIAVEGGSRILAATPTDAARGGRKDRGRVAAEMRPNPEVLTQRTTSPQPPAESAPIGGPNAALLAACGIVDLDEFADQVAVARGSVGRDSVRWSGPCLLAALQAAVKVRGYPPARSAAALVEVARDPATRSPMRLAEAGPWWDRPAGPVGSGESRSPAEDAELVELERLLADRDDRPRLQRSARAALVAEGWTVSRLSVARAAAALVAGSSA